MQKKRHNPILPREARKITWFDVGAKEAKEGKPFRVPEAAYGVQCQYRLGYESIKPIA